VEADDTERKARHEVDTAAADVAAHCAEHDLPRTSEEIEQLQAALAEFQSTISGLVSAMSLVKPLRDAAEQAAATVGQLRAAHKSAADDAASDGEPRSPCGPRRTLPGPRLPRRRRSACLRPDCKRTV
jgi:hypothetical protein